MSRRSVECDRVQNHVDTRRNVCSRVAGVDCRCKMLVDFLAAELLTIVTAGAALLETGSKLLDEVLHLSSDAG